MLGSQRSWVPSNARPRGSTGPSSSAPPPRPRVSYSRLYVYPYPGLKSPERLKTFPPNDEKYHDYPCLYLPPLFSYRLGYFTLLCFILHFSKILFFVALIVTGFPHKRLSLGNPDFKGTTKRTFWTPESRTSVSKKSMDTTIVPIFLRTCK